MLCACNVCTVCSSGAGGCHPEHRGRRGSGGSSVRVHHDPTVSTNHRAGYLLGGFSFRLSTLEELGPYAFVANLSDHWSLAQC